jgi:hypothetical protein
VQRFLIAYKQKAAIENRCTLLSLAESFIFVDNKSDNPNN